MHSKLRNSIAGLYAWRANQIEASLGEKKRMGESADFAYRQALALYPASPDAVAGYVEFLIRERRFEDALLIAKTAAKLAPKEASFKTRIQDLTEKMEKSKTKTR